jgi:hypothetical protein
MHDRPKSFFDVANEMLRKSNPPEMEEKSEKKNPSLPGFLIKNEIDLTKRPK